MTARYRRIPPGAVPRPDLAPGAYSYPPESAQPLNIAPDFDADPAAWRDFHGNDPCVCGHLRAHHYLPDGSQGRCRRCADAGQPSHPFSLDRKAYNRRDPRGPAPRRRRPRR